MKIAEAVNLKNRPSGLWLRIKQRLDASPRDEVFGAKEFAKSIGTSDGSLCGNLDWEDAEVKRYTMRIPGGRGPEIRVYGHPAAIACLRKQLQTL